MSGELPDTACCRKCGYLLRGLPEPVCPECGRVFDPTDPGTYAPSAAWRRRKWIPRIVAILVLAVLVFALAPRGIVKGKIVFTCEHCGHSITVHRWEPYPPKWLHFRYAAFSWTSAATPTPPASRPPVACAQHALSIDAVQEFRGGGSVSATGSSDPGPVGINGLKVTPENAPAVLDSMLTIRGVRITDMDPNMDPLP